MFLVLGSYLARMLIELYADNLNWLLFLAAVFIWWSWKVQENYLQWKQWIKMWCWIVIRFILRNMTVLLTLFCSVSIILFNLYKNNSILCFRLLGCKLSISFCSDVVVNLLGFPLNIWFLLLDRFCVVPAFHVAVFALYDLDFDISSVHSPSVFFCLLSKICTYLNLKSHICDKWCFCFCFVSRHIPFIICEEGSEILVNCSQVHRACIEREIISLLDHPFLPTLYASFQVLTYLPP